MRNDDSETPLSFSESAYWATEISDVELSAQVYLGEQLLSWPRYLPHRVRQQAWAHRLKPSFRRPEV